MSDGQPVSRYSTNLDDGFNAFYECALASTLLSNLFTYSELERIFANASPRLQSRAGLFNSCQAVSINSCALMSWLGRCAIASVVFLLAKKPPRSLAEAQ